MLGVRKIVEFRKYGLNLTETGSGPVASCCDTLILFRAIRYNENDFLVSIQKEYEDLYTM